MIKVGRARRGVKRKTVVNKEGVKILSIGPGRAARCLAGM
jgi:hypothetical protein